MATWPPHLCIFPLPADMLRRKVELLHECFPCQRRRGWWDDEVFLGMARLRGMCRIPTPRRPRARSHRSAVSLYSPVPLGREGTFMIVFVGRRIGKQAVLSGEQATAPLLRRLAK
jgi:hypothetical protein